MGIKVKLVRSHSGASERQVATIVGLGLKKFGSEKLLKDTPAIRGMINKVRHLVDHEIVKDEPKVRVRTKPRAVRLRDAARAAAAKSQAK
jgi:large subunit ribosomal protein L30